MNINENNSEAVQTGRTRKGRTAATATIESNRQSHNATEAETRAYQALLRSNEEKKFQIENVLSGRKVQIHKDVATVSYILKNSRMEPPEGVSCQYYTRAPANVVSADSSS